MSDEPQLVFTPPLSIEETRKRTKTAEKFFTVFCNHVRVALSQTEFRVFIGETYPTAAGELLVTEMLSIVMTPLQAKTTRDLLASMVSAHERQFGEITPPMPVTPSATPAGPKQEKPDAPQSAPEPTTQKPNGTKLPS
jgi:Protein of unknown function (DUF3467)